MKLQLNPNGRPTLYEEGGGATNTGAATVVAGPAGEPLEAHWLGQRAWGPHAAFRPRVGLFLVHFRHSRADGESGTVECVTALDGAEATTEIVARFQEGEWEPELPSFLREAVSAARRKSQCYHCRHAHYVRAGQIAPPQ